MRSATTTAGEQRHNCAVCPKPIKPGFLMCWAHWQLVPQPLATKVLSSWGYLSRAPRGDVIHARSAYFQARQAAIQSVTQQLAPAGAEGQQP